MPQETQVDLILQILGEVLLAGYVFVDKKKLHDANLAFFHPLSPQALSLLRSRAELCLNMKPESHTSPYLISSSSHMLLLSNPQKVSMPQIPLESGTELSAERQVDRVGQALLGSGLAQGEDGNHWVPSLRGLFPLRPGLYERG